MDKRKCTTLADIAAEGPPPGLLKLYPIELTWRQRRELRRLQRQHQQIYFDVPSNTGRKAVIWMVCVFGGAVAGFIYGFMGL